MNSKKISQAITSVGGLKNAYEGLEELGIGQDVLRETARWQLSMISNIISGINYQAGKTPAEGAELCKSVTGREFNVIYEVNPKDPSADLLKIASSSRPIDIAVPVASLANVDAGSLWLFVSENLRCFRTSDTDRNSAVVLSAPFSATLDLTEEDVAGLQTAEMGRDIAMAGEILARTAALTLDPADKLAKEVPAKSRKLQDLVGEAIKSGKLKPDTRDKASIPAMAAQYKKAVGELHKASETLRELNMDPKPGETNTVVKIDPGRTPEEQLMNQIFGTRKTITTPITAYEEVKDADAQTFTGLLAFIRECGIEDRETGTGPIEKVLGTDWRIVAYKDPNEKSVEGMHLMIETPSGARWAECNLRELICADSVATYNFIANDLRDIRVDEMFGGRVERLEASLYKTSMMKDEDVIKAFDDGKGPLLAVSNSILLETAALSLVGTDTVKYDWIAGYVEHFNDMLMENDVLEKAIADIERGEDRPVPEVPAADNPGETD